MIFGTDGVRDIGGKGLLSADSVDRLGSAITSHMAREGCDAGRVLIARDTRLTGPEIEEIITGALHRAGCSTLHAGVLPTPAVSVLLAQGVADLGIVISASHNPPEFNGIKLIAPDGSKLTVEQEKEISADYAAQVGCPSRQDGIDDDPSLGDRYLDSLMGSFPPGGFLQGLSLVLDCARGAGCGWAPEAFRRAGAEVTELHAKPDGARINVGCGSLNPEILGQEVVRTGANLGIALDGDADRALLVDEAGGLVDGDDVIVIWAEALLERGDLEPAVVALTTLSNGGVEQYLRRNGIEVIRTEVGDRAVAVALRESGGLLGGEPSGHIIYHGEAATGDGIRTGLSIAQRIQETGRTLSDLRSGIVRFPQEQRALKIIARPPIEELEHLPSAMEEAEQALLEGGGRILVRYSGTELLLRILVEARTAEEVRRWGDHIENSARMESMLGIDPRVS
ncbi:MAG: phosphoglucosamine mutase [Planctomycetota bacterium]